MFKRFILTALLFVFSQQLSAFQGFYVGGSTGASALVGRQKGTLMTVTDTGAPGAFDLRVLDLNADLIDGAWAGELFVGYGHSFFDYIYTGLEVFFLHSHHKFKETKVNRQPAAIISETSEFEIGSWHTGVDGRLGFLISPSTLLYGRFGVEWSPFNFESNAFLNRGPIIASSKSREKTSAHLRLGIGIEKQIWDHLSLRADYVYTNYNKLSLFDSVTSGVMTLTNDIKVRFHNHALLLGLAYYFSNCPTICVDEACYCREFCGFYLAGAIGGSLFEGKLRGDNSASLLVPGVAAITVDLPEFLTDENFIGTLYGGIAYQWCYIFSALELFVDFNHPHRKSRDLNLLVNPGTGTLLTAAFETRAEIKPFQAGIAFRPGIILTPSTILYGSVGTTFATVELKSEATATFAGPLMATVSDSLSLSGKNTRATLRLGAGLEYAFCPSWHLRADYVYTDYGSIRVRGIATNSAAGSTAAIFGNTKVHFKTHDVTLGIAKYF